jgi:hypothetical protein
VSCDRSGSQRVGTWTDSSGHRERTLAYLDDAFSIRDERGASIPVDRGVTPRYWYFRQGTALFLAVADIRRASRRTSFARRRR